MKIAVTGAFGYSGKYIAQRLLAGEHEVITLTNSPDRDSPLRGRIPAYPFSFDNPTQLEASLRGVEVLINTYWVRFNHARFTQADGVRNTLALFCAARNAGVRRIVHVSITNPDKNSPLEYFRSKALLEEGLVESGLSYAILRPTVLFGKEDILINNIAWALRHLPVIGIFGNGEYKLQPIYVDDLAALAVEQAFAETNVVIDAIGPETFTYRQLVKTISDRIGVKRLIVSTPPLLAYYAMAALGVLMRDVVVTRQEIKGLMSNLLYVPSPPAGTTRLTDWITENADRLGRKYASELARRRNRTIDYELT